MAKQFICATVIVKSKHQKFSWVVIVFADPLRGPLGHTIGCLTGKPKFLIFPF